MSEPKAFETISALSSQFHIMSREIGRKKSLAVEKVFIDEVGDDGKKRNRCLFCSWSLSAVGGSGRLLDHLVSSCERATEVAKCMVRKERGSREPAKTSRPN